MLLVSSRRRVRFDFGRRHMLVPVNTLEEIVKYLSFLLRCRARCALRICRHGVASVTGGYGWIAIVVKCQLSQVSSLHQQLAKKFCLLSLIADDWKGTRLRIYPIERRKPPQRREQPQTTNNTTITHSIGPLCDATANLYEPRSKLESRAERDCSISSF